jgi:hypothetical protein
MTASRHIKPQVEAMESVFLLSTLGLHPKRPDTKRAPLVAHQKDSISLAGNLQGAMQPISTYGTAGPAFYSLNGTGEVGALGSVNVTARVTYYPASSAASGGTITLTGGKGTIKLALMGPLWDGTLPAPSFSFHVASATGHYRRMRGIGTAVITLTPQTSGYDGIQGLGAPGGTGTFTVQLNPA